MLTVPLKALIINEKQQFTLRAIISSIGIILTYLQGLLLRTFLNKYQIF